MVELFFNISFFLKAGSKAQFARDDPAFLVLLGIWLCCKYYNHCNEIISNK